jgi:cytochrome c peroxidase
MQSTQAAVAARRRIPIQFPVLVTLAIAALSGTRPLFASTADDEDDLGPLSELRVPRPSNLRDFVRNEQVAIALGKALFWDAQVGGDGMTACASCHFSAGTDARVVNTLNPGRNGVFEVAPLAGHVQADDFPIQTDDVVGSQGVVDGAFVGIVPGSAVDLGTPTPNAMFLGNRQTTGRNTPTTINAVFNVENFWDGRAKNTFNGRHPGGRDSNAKLLRIGSGGSLSRVAVEIRNSSAASQSVGPPNNGVEMSFEGRSFFDLGKKMLSLRPLALQQVAGDDSVLGSLRASSGLGLATSYADLIRQAFQPRWWDSNAVVDANLNFLRNGTPSGLDEFSVMEANFSLFWGLAVQMYVSTLISGDSPFDRFERGDRAALTELQRRGRSIFAGEGECTECHSGPLFSEIADGTGGNAFVHTGVRPARDDAGRGEGEFKTPTIRNAELTGPYFHNGGYGTLRQVVDFYGRGGDFPEDAEIDELDLSEVDKVALVAFMLSTTDERVRFQRAPFDHPSLLLPNGDALPAVGRNGGPEIRPFLGLDPFDAGDGQAAMIVADQRSKLALAGTQELVLVSYANRGRVYWLYASLAGTGLPLPEQGLSCPQPGELEALFARAGLELVATGTLDGVGIAQVELPTAPPGTRDGLELFFVILDPLTREVMTVSGPARVALLP